MGWGRAFDTALGGLLAGGHALATLPWRVPRPDSIALQQRLAAFPRAGLPLREPVTIHWNTHQVPFIEAATDDDLAVTLGQAHVHLRWAQMEVMRHVALGRVAELAGPLAIPIDRALRGIGIARAAPAIAAALPEETTRWLEAFVAGINHAVRHSPALPAEFRLLGLRRAPWHVTDVLAIGRLAAADVTWTIWRALLSEHDDRLVAALWRRATGLGDAADTPRERDQAAARLLRQATRLGSNALAVAPSRGGGAGAWIASDTHLPALLPNLWLIAGCKSPSFHMVGLMIPGVPAMALGRNSWIAWGGTNLHAASSDLFDVSGLPPDTIATREEEVRVRWGRRRRIAVRETAHGPIVSDGTMLPRRDGRAIALRWMGHAPSDEITALLGVNRARDWAEFRAALEGFALPGQNMVYADRDGHIGKVMAVHLPRRPPTPPPGPVRPPRDAALWDAVATGRDLPAQLDPAEGYVASANDKPNDAPILIGYCFSSPARVNRLRQVLAAAERIDFAALAALQQDTAMPSALPVRDRLVRLMRARAGDKELRAALEEWDGRYGEASAGALAFEALLFRIALGLRGKQRTGLYSRFWGTRDLLFRDLERIPDRALAAILARAAPRAGRALRRYGSWGRMHRLSPRHFLAALPIIGRAYGFADHPAAGGSETVLKTANPLTDRPHRVGLAATARHISDLSDLDGNHFVLLGGQDGWLGSTTLRDQVPLWRQGAYIRVPLRLETVRAEFPFRTELRP